jgi:FkbM family methyltransferase
MSLSIEEKEALSAITKHFNDKPVIFDVGANVGAWTDAVMEDVVLHQAFLFEPNSVLVDGMGEKYIKLEPETGTEMVIVEAAAYKEDGQELDFFYFTNENNGLSSIYHNEKWDYLPMQRGKVKSVTLDSFCKNHHIEKIDCIKIDVEGAEYDVLQGCKYILENKIARFLQVEYSPHYKLNNLTFMDVVRFVTQYGYAAYSWEFGEFKKITEENFVENFRLENFIITFELMEDFSQHWNSEFIKNTQGLGKIDLVIEIGCFEGITTKYICKNLLNEGGRVICVDPLQDEYLTDNLSEEDIKANKEYGFFKNQYYRFKKNTQGLPVQLVRKTSNTAIRELIDLRVDFIYVDGDHRFQGVYDDGVNYFEVLKIGGLMLFDDANGYRQETTDGINLFLEWCGDRIEIISSNYQLLIKKLAP